MAKKSSSSVKTAVPAAPAQATGAGAGTGAGMMMSPGKVMMGVGALAGIALLLYLLDRYRVINLSGWVDETTGASRGFGAVIIGDVISTTQAATTKATTAATTVAATTTAAAAGVIDAVTTLATETTKAATTLAATTTAAATTMVAATTSPETTTSSASESWSCTAQKDGAYNTCKFPFVKDGKEFNGCVREKSDIGNAFYYWCSYDETYNGRWGYCDISNIDTKNTCNKVHEGTTVPAPTLSPGDALFEPEMTISGMGTWIDNMIDSDQKWAGSDYKLNLYFNTRQSIEDTYKKSTYQKIDGIYRLCTPSSCPKLTQTTEGTDGKLYVNGYGAWKNMNTGVIMTKKGGENVFNFSDDSDGQVNDNNTRIGYYTNSVHVWIPERVFKHKDNVTQPIFGGNLRTKTKPGANMKCSSCTIKFNENAYTAWSTTLGENAF